MSKSSITRQFMLLVVAFATAVPLSLGGLTYFFQASRSGARQRTTITDRRTDGLLALVETVGQMQGTVQQLLREKDPDSMEKLMEQNRAAAKAVAVRIRDAGDNAGELATAYEALNGSNEKSIEFLLRGDAGQAQQVLIENSNPAFERLTSAIGKLQRRMIRDAGAETTASDTAESRLQTTIFALVVVLNGILVALALLLVRRIAKSLRQVLAELRTASDGNACSAAEITAASRTLAQGASEQAASLEETSASSEEISSITEKNAANAQLAAEKMEKAASQIADVHARLDQLVVSMNEINSSSDQISKIIQVIESVAFQTNILALNAAVEAARAGEAGMGFAVVADEVRSLAQRCSQAARDTAGLIETSIGKTKEGKNKLDEVAATFRGITDSAREVNALVDEVRAASQEQARGVKQISAALVQMQQVTQQSAAGAEQSAASGEDLASQSRAMKDTVTRLAAMVNGPPKPQ